MVSLYSGQFFIEKVSYQNKIKGYTIYETNKKDLVVWTKDYNSDLELECQYTISNLAIRKYKDKEQFHTTESSSLERIEAVSTPKSGVGRDLDVSSSKSVSPIELDVSARKAEDSLRPEINEFFHCPHCNKKVFFYREKVI